MSIGLLIIRIRAKRKNSYKEKKQHTIVPYPSTYLGDTTPVVKTSFIIIICGHKQFFFYRFAKVIILN